MTIRKALYPRDNIDRLNMSRKEGGRGLAVFEDCVDSSTQGFENYVKKSKEGLRTTANCSITYTNTDRKNNKTKKQKWEEKQMSGYFVRQKN